MKSVSALSSKPFKLKVVPDDGSVAHNEGYDLEDNPFCEGCPGYRSWRYEWLYMNRKVQAEINSTRH